MMKLELHLLQNFAPSCLNRDDTNTPKDCEFGGVRRARISSQCLKKAIRDYWRANGTCDVGCRTKRLAEKLVPMLAARGKPEADAAPAVTRFLDLYYSKADGNRPEETAVLLYLGEPEIAEAAACIEESWDGLVAAAKSKAGKAGKGAKSVELKPDRAVRERLRKAGLSSDVALFGRMLAEQPDGNIEAACQVAQSIWRWTSIRRWTICGRTRSPARG
jgi:CRISPR system Cascade subunit CasC